MPRLRTVQSLKTVCLVSIAKNMDNVWCADLIRNPNPTYSYLIGPFEYFTSDLMQSLLEILISMNQLKRIYLPLLINNHVVSLDLTAWFKYNINATTIYNIMKARCTRLTHLKLNHPRIPPKFASSVFELLPNLISLDLSYTSCTDDILTNVTSSCPNLQILKLAFCSAITDLGIANLSGGWGRDASSSVPSQQRCGSKISYLDVSYTDVSVAGLVLALRRMSSLQHLECTDISVALYKLLEDHFTLNTPLQTFPFRLLNIEVHTEPGAVDYVDVVGAACTLCPAAVEVYVTGRAANQAVVVLSRLENLGKLHVSNHPGQPICFQAGLLTMLQINGSGLTTLTLHDVNGVDLDVIAACCPRIATLTCTVTHSTKHPFSCGNVVPNSAVNHLPFSALEFVELNLVEPAAQCPVQFLSLLLAHALPVKVIKFAGLGQFSDDVVDEILTTNPLRHLEVLQITNCKTVTFASIRKILELPNELTTLDLVGCFDMSLMGYESCKKMVAGRNYDFTFKYT